MLITLRVERVKILSKLLFFGNIHFSPFQKKEILENPSYYSVFLVII